MFSRFISSITRTQLETGKVCIVSINFNDLLLTGKFGFYLFTPILVMIYTGINSDEKFNLPGFWPDPATLNQIPKERHEIKAEVARIRKEREEKRKRLEAKARELGIVEEL